VVEVEVENVGVEPVADVGTGAEVAEAARGGETSGYSGSTGGGGGAPWAGLTLAALWALTEA